MNSNLTSRAGEKQESRCQGACQGQDFHHLLVQGRCEFELKDCDNMNHMEVILFSRRRIAIAKA